MVFIDAKGGEKGRYNLKRVKELLIECYISCAVSFINRGIREYDILSMN
jgi:hypothetical protein